MISDFSYLDAYALIGISSSFKLTVTAQHVTLPQEVCIKLQVSILCYTCIGVT